MTEEKAILERLRDGIVNFDIKGVQKACREALRVGLPPYRAIVDGMARGMEIVGQKYEVGEYFLAELIMAGETMKEGMKILEPYLKAGDMKAAGRVVIGTVRGDLHDIGKNVVIMLLQAAGFEVIDLGIDVPAVKFVEAVREHEPDILAMSALLTATMMEMKNVIEGLKKAGLREKVKVIIGGAPVTPEYAEEIGADAAAKDAVEGVRLCEAWMAAKCFRHNA